MRQLKKQSPRAIKDENDIMKKVPSQQDFVLLNLIAVSLFERIISDFSKHKSINPCNNEEKTEEIFFLDFLV